MRTSLGLLLGLALLGAACGKGPREQSANREVPRVAYVRAVNAMPDGPAIDVFAGDQELFPKVKPGAVVPYREVSPGLIAFRARWTGREADVPVADNREILRDGKYATILLRPATGRREVDMTILKDHTWLPDAGKAKVRVVHAIAGMGNVDAYSQGKKVLGGVDFTDESRYVEVDPVMGELVLKRHDNHQTVATVSNLRLDRDKAYTLLLVGSENKPRTIVLEDRVEKAPAIPTQYPLSS
jgi:hypothetical protein